MFLKFIERMRITMNNFKETYCKEFEDELKQFLFLCGKNDAQLLLSQTEKSFSTEHIRLACICMAFDYKKILLKIFTLAQKNVDCFFKELENLNGNFMKINEWVSDFIDNIDAVEAKKIAIEFWQERKKTLDVENFNIKNLLKY